MINIYNSKEQKSTSGSDRNAYRGKTRMLCQRRHHRTVWNVLFNKKVLLRERKRHTDRGISSTPSAVLSLGGTPSQVPLCPYLAWGVPIPGQGSIPSLVGEYPIRVPLILTWSGVGYHPSPPPSGGQSENITSCHTTYAVGKKHS